ncbi:MAG TPA: thioredoxin domain-containing protein [Cyclobacteriaceae bacterium]|nr:thioredoxin domain-containing protein [Cyclobacteriaceae bacterium]
MNTNSKANRLINSTSPYLLQHAYNPVDWFEWGMEALAKAKQEDKPILVSIGYSSCHWCHVMERECFEKEAIAQIMNELFVCIKVDREERPDVDQIYMDSVQAMGINGGWPLNVFLTPDQRPFYGGTYFPPSNWVQILKSIHQAYTSRRSEVEESAESLAHHLSQSDTQRFKQKAADEDLNLSLENIYKKLEGRFDRTWGGLDKAPKFVMPSIWLWLLRYHHITKNKAALHQVLLTLRKVAMGGIYDQVGGGFARYSVDGEWFAPHFEKMLYDNAQLLSLYAEAFALTKDEEFRIVINETFEWLQREMTHASGGFYSALDADSEGVEGKFYIWNNADLKSLLGKDADLLINYYSCTDTGNWEHGHNILFRTQYEDEFLKTNSLKKDEWNEVLSNAKKILLQERAKRIRPGLDDKIITSWNALMICGLVDCYKALGDEKFLEAALKNMHFIKKELLVENRLLRSYKDKPSSIKAFLDDYAYVILANVKLYQVTFDEQWLELASALTEKTIQYFFDQEDGYFHFTANDSEKLIASKKEIFDNVIPSSNSVMAIALFHLGTLTENEEWIKMSTSMVDSLSHLIKAEPNYTTNWAIAFTEIKKGMAEVAFVGEKVGMLKKEFHKHFQPFALTMGTEEKSSLPLLKDKYAIDNKSTVFVCFDKACKAPVHKIEDAILQLN